MKHLLLLFIIPLIFIGCSDLTPEQIGELKRRCEAIGMRDTLLINGFTSGVRDVTCREKE